MTLAAVRTAITSRGLAYRGAFHPDAGDLPAGVKAGTLVLTGCIGNQSWPAFSASPEYGDGNPNPLDRWSRRVIGTIAKEVGAAALFPFDGPPWLPFQHWAQKAESLHPSPLGMLIHPDWGLWHSWRGALAFDVVLALPIPDRRPSPCESCAARPCLNACPVNAFTTKGYDSWACVQHLLARTGADCMDAGCVARRACPVGVTYRYGLEQACFHMEAFRHAQSVSAV